MSGEIKVTMQDIADRVGVDQSTVSLALRDSSKISEKTRQCIKEIAQEMGYYPNPFVSALMQTRKGKDGHADLLRLAYITFEEISPTLRTGHIYADFEMGAHTAAKQLGFKLEKFGVTKEMSIARIDKIISARGIRGVIIAPLPDRRSRVCLSWDQLSCVTLGPTLRNPLLHRVMSDHYDNMQLLLDYSMETGYHRVGFCEEGTTDCRTRGYWTACYLNFMMHQKKNMMNIPVLFLGESSKRRFVEWVETYKPDLVIGVRSAQLMKWLDEEGYKIPRDISVATVAVAHSGGDLSGVVEDGVTAGSMAVRKLASMVYTNERGTPKLPIKLLIPSTINFGTTMQ